MNDELMVPTKLASFVPFGNFDLIKKIVKSGRFSATHIAGESGNGKTTLVEQACAQLERELITVQITKATTESHLMGDFRLVNGNTPFYYGPVLEAYKRGAVLLLDELTQCDTVKIMALQNVLANKALFIQKTGEIIEPRAGFCVISTGNSFGEGDLSDSQHYIGEEVLNEAFRDRFSAVLFQTYPDAKTEKKILANNIDTPDEVFIDNLVRWAHNTRLTFEKKQISAQITTRRLIHIIHNYNLVQDRKVAVELALNRYVPEVREGFLGSYAVFDPTITL